MVATTYVSPAVGTSRFYVWMAAACAVVAIGGFAPTYWLQLPAGTFVGQPLIHVHAAVFTAWPLLFLSQTWLAANNRLEHHRAWGMAGISLATMLFVLGAVTAIQSADLRAAKGDAERGLAFLIIPMSAICLFAGLFAAAVLNLARPQIHKRLVLLATIALLQPALVRVFFMIKTGGGPGLRPGVNGPPPIATTIGPALVADLFVLAAILYDWRTRGRPHPVYLIGLAILLVVQFGRIPLSQTPQWKALASALTALV